MPHPLSSLLIGAGVALAAHASQADDRPGYSFTFICQSPDYCAGGAEPEKAARTEEVKEIVTSTLQDAAPWLDEIGLPSSKTMEGGEGHLVFLKNGVCEGDPCVQRDDDEWRMFLPIVEADEGRARLDGPTVVHEWMHTLSPPGKDKADNDWLSEALSEAAASAWSVRSPDTPFYTPIGWYPAGLDKAFNYRPEDDPAYFGYAKGDYLRQVGLWGGSPDGIGWLGPLVVLNGETGGMSFLYEDVPPGQSFREAFPRYLAMANSKARITEDYGVFYDSITEAKESFDAKTQRTEHYRGLEAVRFGAKAVSLNRYRVEADRSLPPRERLVAARIEVENSTRPDETRTVFEHEYRPDGIYQYLFVAEGDMDAGFVRTAYVPERHDAPGPEKITYDLVVTMTPVTLDYPAEAELCGGFEVRAEDVSLTDLPNVRLEATNADVEAGADGFLVTPLVPGTVDLTLVIEPHVTRAPNGSEKPHRRPDIRVDLEPVTALADEDCVCSGEVVAEMTNPRLNESINMFNQAFGGEMPEGGMQANPLAEMLSGLMAGPGGRGAPASARVSLVGGSVSERGRTCVFPFAIHRGSQFMPGPPAGTPVLDFFTPSPDTVLGGGGDAFAVAHSGWYGWPRNARFQLQVALLGTAAGEIEAGRAYPAWSYGLGDTGFQPVFTDYEGTFHPYFPYQEAFTGQSRVLAAPSLKGVVWIDDIEGGMVAGRFALSTPKGVLIETEHLMKEGNVTPSFYLEGTETGAAVSIRGAFVTPLAGDLRAVVRRAGRPGGG